MRQTLKNREITVPAVLALALTAMVFRLTGVMALQTAAALLAAVLAVLTARLLTPRPGFAANHRPSPALLLPLPAALLLLLAAVLRRFAKAWFAAAAGLAGAACMGIIAVQTISRRTPSPYLYMGLTLSVVCKLIPDFRAWSVDPMVTDYCFRLFALIAVMGGVFHLGGFAMDMGKRRLTVFFCICGVVFCLMAAADGGTADVLTYLGFALYLGSALWTLMRPGRKRRPAPPQDTETPAQ